MTSYTREAQSGTSGTLSNELFLTGMLPSHSAERWHWEPLWKLGGRRWRRSGSQGRAGFARVRKEYHVELKKERRQKIENQEEIA